jgi:hypothetical protein
MIKKYSALLLPALLAWHIGAAQPKVNADAALIQDFSRRVADYVKLRKTALEGLPPISNTGKKGDILDQQHLLAERIRQARPAARQGDICPPDIAAEMRRLILLAMQGNNAARIRRSLHAAEPIALPLQINSSFPEKLPLQSTPPTLLANLPVLPPELEYRIVGRALVLRDTTANIIVDFVPDALPASK